MPAKKAQTNSADSDQTASEKQSDPGLYCFAILEKDFVNSSLDNQYFISEQKEFEILEQYPRQLRQAQTQGED